MNFNKLFLIGSLSSILAVTSHVVFAEDEKAPHFKVTVNDQLVQDVNVEVVPTRYLSSIWDGKCVDSVYSSTNKAICTDVKELVNGIPALVIPQTINENNEAEVFMGSYSPYSVFGGLPYYLMPFKGHIVIKNKAGDLIADISYSMKAHNATYLGLVKRLNNDDKGTYMQWDTLVVTSHDPHVNVNVAEKYPTGYNWCYFNEKMSEDNSKTPCSASPVITLSIAQ
jgi:hypothetical protein